MIAENLERNHTLLLFWGKGSTLSQVSKMTGISEKLVWYYFNKFKKKAKKMELDQKQPASNSSPPPPRPSSVKFDEKEDFRLAKIYLLKVKLISDLSNQTNENFENPEQIAYIFSKVKPEATTITVEELEAYNRCISKAKLSEAKKNAGFSGYLHGADAALKSFEDQRSSRDKLFNDDPELKRGEMEKKIPIPSGNLPRYSKISLKSWNTIIEQGGQNDFLLERINFSKYSKRKYD